MTTAPEVGREHARVVPPAPDGDLATTFEFWRHVFPYAEALRRLDGARRVLEVGTGEGYGAALLSSGIPVVIATDYSSDAVRHARDRYRNIRLCQASGAALPFAAGSCDAVVSFQVIEHIPEAQAFLEEAGRVLRPGGTLVLTTPNRKLRLLPGQRPWNEFHVREYSGAQLGRLVRGRFQSVQLLGVVARDDLMRLEEERVSPYRRLRRGVLRRLALRRPVAGPGAAQASSVRLEDFSLTPEFDRSLDLFVIARKSE